MVKFVTLEQAVKENLQDGAKVAFEGFTHLIPMAAGHEAIRQGLKNLTLIRMTPDILYDQMVGMGMAKKLIYSYAGNPGVGLLRRLRDALENSWPNKPEIEEHSHAGMANAYAAGASGLPCAIFRGYIGVDIEKINPNVKWISCPFSGEKLVAIPAIRADSCFIHAQKADAKGNILIEGITGVQKEAALGAEKVVVTVEEIVDELSTHPNATILPHWTIDAIAKVPGGAHPSYTQGYYKRDNATYLEWAKISTEREVFLKWMQENVLEATPEIFAERSKKL